MNGKISFLSRLLTWVAVVLCVCLLCTELSRDMFRYPCGYVMEKQDGVWVKTEEPNYERLNYWRGGTITGGLTNIAMLLTVAALFVSCRGLSVSRGWRLSALILGLILWGITYCVHTDFFEHFRRMQVLLTDRSHLPTVFAFWYTVFAGGAYVLGRIEEK